MVVGAAIRNARSCVANPGSYQETSTVGPDELRGFSMRVASRFSILVAALAACAGPVAGGDVSTHAPAAQPILAAPPQPLSLWELRLGASVQEPSARKAAASTPPPSSCPETWLDGKSGPRSPHPACSRRRQPEHARRHQLRLCGLHLDVRFHPAALRRGQLRRRDPQRQYGPGGGSHPTNRAWACSPLFRESASLGYRFTQNWSMTIGARSGVCPMPGLCSQNRGLTNVGVRLGYAFLTVMPAVIAIVEPRGRPPVRTVAGPALPALPGFLL